MPASALECLENAIRCEEKARRATDALNFQVLKNTAKMWRQLAEARKQEMTRGAYGFPVLAVGGGDAAGDDSASSSR